MNIIEIIAIHMPVDVGNCAPIVFKEGLWQATRRESENRQVLRVPSACPHSTTGAVRSVRIGHREGDLGGASGGASNLKMRRISAWRERWQQIAGFEPLILDTSGLPGLGTALRCDEFLAWRRPFRKFRNVHFNAAIERLRWI